VTVSDEPGQGEYIEITHQGRRVVVSRHWTTKTDNPKAQHKFLAHRIDDVLKLLGLSDN